MEQPEQQMIPPVEPVRRMTETERLLMNELMYAQASALHAQQQYAALLAAYQQQSQELTAARAQIAELQTHRCPAVGVLQEDAEPDQSPLRPTWSTVMIGPVQDAAG